MKTIITALIVSGFVASFALVAKAQGKDYRTVLSECSAMWKASDQRKVVVKGQGMQAWQEFRRDCVAKSGYVKKAKAKAQG